MVAWIALIGTTALLTSGQDGPAVVLPNQEVRVTNLPFLASSSSNASAVLASALETILHDKAVCCGKNSALENIVLSAPQSLSELSAKLQGRHVLNDGRSVAINGEYVAHSEITPDYIVSTLLHQRAPLIEWKSHLFYVLYGATFDETRYDSGERQYAIRKLLLLDLRFSDQRRQVEFDRQTGDWSEVGGLAAFSVARQ